MLDESDLTLAAESDYSHMDRSQNVPMSLRKARRTYGWCCPFDNYKSNRHYNTQRHIQLIHGEGSGDPLDSLTRQTREENIRNDRVQGTSSKTTPDSNYIMNNSYRPINSIKVGHSLKDNQLSAWNEQAYDTPILNAATKRIKELGYYPAGNQMTNAIPQATSVRSSAQNYINSPNFRPGQGMLLDNRPNPSPNPYNTINVSQNRNPAPNDPNHRVPELPQNALLRMYQDLYNLLSRE
jgi:hypothetical protein